MSQLTINHHHFLALGRRQDKLDLVWRPSEPKRWPWRLHSVLRNRGGGGRQWPLGHRQLTLSDCDRPQWLGCFRCSLYHQTWDNIRTGNQPSLSKSGEFYGAFPGPQTREMQSSECVYCEQLWVWYDGNICHLRYCLSHTGSFIING